MQIKNTKQNIFLLIVITAITIFAVFFLKVDLTRYRIIQEVWNLGHVFLFIGIYYLVYRLVLNRLELTLISEILIIIISSFILGYGIEVLQTYTGRDKSSYDVLLDCVGAVIAFILFSSLLTNSEKHIRYILTGLVMIFSVTSLYPMYINIHDSINQRLEFPILLSNKTRIETTRINKSHVEIDVIEKSLRGINSKFLRAEFTPAQYSTISLQGINEDWSQYNYFRFSIFNPLKQVSSVVLRIHDHGHRKTDFSFDDRFNTKLILNFGWNNFNIKLSDVKYSPKYRDMNMHRIEGLMFFKMNINKSELLYFSSLRLVK